MSLNIEVTRPEEGQTWAGYWTVNAILDGQELYHGAFAPELVEDVDPADVAHAFAACLNLEDEAPDV